MPASTHPPASGRLTKQDAVIAAALALLPMLVFWPVAALREVFFTMDLQLYHYPFRVLLTGALRAGELPLWNPYANSGMPLLGSVQAGLFYPVHGLFFLMPGYAAMSYGILLQFSLAGVGCYLCFRSLGLGKLPSAFSAVGYMFSGYAVSRIVHFELLAAAALLPPVFLCVRKALAGGSPGWCAASSLVLALQIFNGHFQVPVYTAVALMLLALVLAAEQRIGQGGWHWFWRLPLKLSAMYALAAGLCAIQLLPWVELTMRSVRGTGSSPGFIFGSAVGICEALLFLFPYLHGSLDVGPYSRAALSPEKSSYLWEHSGYVGILPLALAVVGIVWLAICLRREHGRPAATNPLFHGFYFALLGLVGICLASGKPAFLRPIIFATPVLGRLRETGRALILIDFALLGLAALGLNCLLAAGPSLERWMRPTLRLVAAAFAVVPVLLACTLHLGPVRRFFWLEGPDLDNFRLDRPNAYVPLGLCLATAVVLFLWSLTPVKGWKAALALLVLAVDVASFAPAYHPTTSPRLYTDVPAAAAFLRGDQTPHRKVTYLPSFVRDWHLAREVLTSNWGMPYRIEDANGMINQQDRRYTDYMFRVGAVGVSSGLLDDAGLFQADNPVLHSLNVKYVLVPREFSVTMGDGFDLVYTGEHVRIYLNRNAYPRAYFADRAVGEDLPAHILQTVKARGFDGRRLALVESWPAPAPELSPPSPSDAVLHIRASLNQIALTTSTQGNRFLVLSEMAYPGWRAYVDGGEVPLYRANYLFRGLVAPAGRHEIVLCFRPPLVLAGSVISGLSLLVLACLAGYRRLSTLCCSR